MMGQGSRLTNTKGVTLIEVLLVLVVATSIFVMALQTINQFKMEQQINQIALNVDQLFIGARNYFLANCRASRDYNSGNVITTSTGQLDPTVNTPPTASKALNMMTQLVNPGYLAKWPPTYTPNFVSGYLVQLNLYRNSPKSVNFCYNNGTTTVNCQAQKTAASDNAYQWTIQVAVQVRDPTLASYYKGRLNANCVSSLVGGIVTPCGSNPTASNYLVFERLPSKALSSANTSPLWPSIERAELFTRQYTNDDDYAVTNDDATYNNLTGYENYLCGG